MQGPCHSEEKGDDFHNMLSLRELQDSGIQTPNRNAARRRDVFYFWNRLGDGRVTIGTEVEPEGTQ